MSKPNLPTGTRFRVVRHAPFNHTAWRLGAEVRRVSDWVGSADDAAALFADARHPMASCWARLSEVEPSNAIITP